MVKNNIEDALLKDIAEHSLEADNTAVDHDTIIMIQAQKLMEVGYLEYEAAVYGTAYIQDGNLKYYICEQEQAMDKFMGKCLREGIFATPAKYFYQRYDLMDDSVDKIKKDFRIAVAKKLKRYYSGEFFEAIQDLTALKPQNQAYEILKEVTEQLDSCFNTCQLDLFQGLLEMLMRGRHINNEGYKIFHDWLDTEYGKFLDDIMVGRYKKQYSGFAYQKNNGEIKYYCDAYTYMAKEKQVKYITRGDIVTPVLSKKYYQTSYQQLEKEKNDFEGKLHQYLDSNYIKLMQLIKALPSTVDAKKYNKYLNQLKEAGDRVTIDTFMYFGALWNAYGR